ncbi:flavodoxin family protein [Clostridium sp. UBA6640]|uniref:flavodoxin family protein n=1 Tax=Clostridium sp. UBA6640 TaxID=1946370 RepID=UPI0025C2CCBA|nr:hypothetical protein [Clostridium sp. UBA6640]
MKTLILFYSLDGLLKNLSETMKEEIKGDLLELKDVKNNTGIYDKVPYKSFIEDNLNLETLGEDIKSYELIVLAVPNWFYKLPIGLKRSTLGNIFSGKKIALFTLGKDLKNIRDRNELFFDSDILGEINLDIIESKDKDGLNKCKIWIKKMYEKGGGKIMPT